MPLAGPKIHPSLQLSLRHPSFQHHHSALQSVCALTMEMKLQKFQDVPSRPQLSPINLASLGFKDTDVHVRGLEICCSVNALLAQSTYD